MERSELDRSYQLHTTKSMEGTSFHNVDTQKGNNNTKLLAYTTLVRPIIEYVVVGWDRYLSMERWVGTDTGVCSGGLGQVLEYVAVGWDRYLSM